MRVLMALNRAKGAAIVTPNVLVSGGPLQTENVAPRFRPVRST